jgi:tetratricopeptide (TPR) repeat protein
MPRPTAKAPSFRALTRELDELLERKDFAPARTKIARALEGAVTPAQKRALVSRLFWVAGGLQRLEAYGRAISTWTLYLKHDPRTARAWQYRGRCFFHLGEPRKAIRDFTRQLELAPEDRAGWLSRAEAYAANGDAARAAADQARADAIYDFPIPPPRLRELRALLAADPERNLALRLEHFRNEDRALADKRFAFVPLIQEYGWTCAHFAADAEAPLDLTYTVGLFYRFGHPELHVRSRGVDPMVLKARLNAIGQRIAQGHEVGASPEEGLRFRPARKDVLELYPFGFGEYFYRHFADTSVVPLRMATLRAARGEA